MFNKPKFGEAAVARSDCGAAKYGPAPMEPWVDYDFVAAIYVLCEKDEAEGTGPLDCINLLLDIANCTGEGMPASYRKRLKHLPTISHSTTNREVSLKTKTSHDGKFMMHSFGRSGWQRTG